MSATEPPFFKIGIAKNPHRRLTDLQVSCPFDLVVFYKRRYATRELAFREESRLHGFFRKKHRRGEWFQLDQTDMQGTVTAPGVRYEQARKTLEAIASRQARSKALSRSRSFNRALGLNVANLNDAGVRDLGRTAGDVGTRATTQGQTTPCPAAFVHIPKRRFHNYQQLEFTDLN
jgi:Meiotically up-regulated gene 113